MWYRLRTVLFIFLCLFASASFSQTKWPNTFLWRITGNGLTKPSYLYGTIHLQDKRLFQFSDSLYHFLETAEGFALEVDFNEFLDSVFARAIHDTEEELLENQRVEIDKRKLDKSADSILKKLGIKGDNITKKDLKKIRDYRMNKLVHQGEMQTIVDGYLYGLALRQGKWIGGIEDVNDQLDLKDELGANLTPDEVFLPEYKLRSSINEMIRVYINHDLQKLADYVDSEYDIKFKDELLIHRNVKMARRMDSLSALRTMFFAVGVAHLPGDSGVISLLRRRGFTVEPVFSPQSITPEAYASKLNTIPWQTVDGDGLYSIQMPGVPSEYNMFGEAMKMKVFFDLPTMTFYMTGHTIGGASSLENSDQMFTSMADRMGGAQNKVKPREVSFGGINGKEASFDVPAGTYRVALLQKNSTLYLLMAGSSKKANVSAPEVNKFFTSFLPKDVAVDEKRWTAFSMPGKGWKVLLPGNPKPNKQIDRTEGASWSFSTYDLIDNQKGFYYLLQARDIKPGYFIQGDSMYFEVYKEDISESFDRILSEKQFSFKGWPAHKMEVLLKNNLKYFVQNIIRGNRVYLLVAGGDKASDFSEVEQVLNSIELEEYPSAEWKRYESKGFNTIAPAPITKVVKDSTEENENEYNSEHFVSYDSLRAEPFDIFKSNFSPHYWIESDSLFFESQLNSSKTYEDSVLQKQIVYNGKLKGLELVIQKPGSSLLKKTRMFVNGDTLYQLLTFLPPRDLEQENLKKFFTGFKVLNEIEPSIYTRKPKQLLNALLSKDTVEFSKALNVLEQVSFTKEDLPLLHGALLQTYIKRENDYRSVNDRIVSLLEDLADESTIQFVADNYKKLDKEKEELKYDLLEVLANKRTKESYALLKSLLMNSLPSRGSSDNLSYALNDSLALTASLYPDILSLSSDSTFAELLVSRTGELLDTNMVSMKDIVPYEQNFLFHSGKILEVLKEDEENWWSYSGWVPFIGRFNDKESNELLTQFSQLKEHAVKYDALLELIKNNQPVSTADIEVIAGDKNYRTQFYNELKKINKLKLFPAKYATQLKIAEGEIYALGNDDDYEPSSVIFIGDKVVDFMGKKQKFYLFKVSYSGDDETTSYLGITGPYLITGKEIITESDAAGLNWDEEFSKPKIEQQFKKYIADTEDYLKKRQSPSNN